MGRDRAPSPERPPRVTSEKTRYPSPGKPDEDDEFDLEAFYRNRLRSELKGAPFGSQFKDAVVVKKHELKHYQVQEIIADPNVQYIKYEHDSKLVIAKIALTILDPLTLKKLHELKKNPNLASEFQDPLPVPPPPFVDPSPHRSILKSPSNYALKNQSDFQSTSPQATPSQSQRNTVSRRSMDDQKSLRESARVVSIERNIGTYNPQKAVDEDLANHRKVTTEQTRELETEAEHTFQNSLNRKLFIEGKLSDILSKDNTSSLVSYH